MPSAKLARRHEERKSKVAILPNPFGGVNTHLWSKDAYIVGIVPVVRLAYSHTERLEKERRRRACLLGSVFREKT